MPTWTHDTPDTCGALITDVSNNLFDAGLKFYTQSDILDCMQDSYNKIFARLTPLEYSALITQPAQPYYDFVSSISNFMYLVAIYNPQTLLWVEGMTYKQFKSEYQTFMVIGQPKFCCMQSLRRAIIWPYDPAATGSTYLYVIFKAIAPTITANHIPQLPLSTGYRLLEYFTTATCLEQRREFKKAGTWWDKIFKYDPRIQQTSLWDQTRKEIKDIARIDRDTVLEPYRWIFHGGAFNAATQITGETPSGSIDGTNQIFYLANVPNPTASLIVTVNAVTQVLEVDYQLNGQTLWFTTIPPNNATILASYQIQ